MSKVKALGEIALRVKQLGPMVEFYQDTIGLELIRHEKQMAFFRIADGYAGHTQVLALFDRSEEPSNKSRAVATDDGLQTHVDHIAFTIAKEDFESEGSRLKELGRKVTYAYHEWVQWKSLYVADPDGNTVELVCFDEDPSLPEN